MSSEIASRREKVDLETLCVLVDYLVGEMCLAWAQETRGTLDGAIIPACCPLGYNISDRPPLHRKSINLEIARWSVLPIARLLAEIASPSDNTYGIVMVSFDSISH